MSKTRSRITTLFIALSLAGLGLTAGVAPRFEGSTQAILIGTGLSLFTSGLTTFLAGFLEESSA